MDRNENRARQSTITYTGAAQNLHGAKEEKKKEKRKRLKRKGDNTE